MESLFTRSTRNIPYSSVGWSHYIRYLVSISATKECILKVYATAYEFVGKGDLNEIVKLLECYCFVVVWFDSLDTVRACFDECIAFVDGIYK